MHVCSQSYLRHTVTSHVLAIVGDALAASQNGDNCPPLAAMPGVELCFENAWSPIPVHEEWKLEILLYYVQILKPGIHRTWWIWSVCKCVSHSMGFPPLCYLFLLWLDSERGWQNGDARPRAVSHVYIYLCICIYIYTYVYIYIRVCVYVCVWRCVYMFKRAHVHAYVYLYINEFCFVLCL